MVHKTFGIYANDLSGCRLFIEAGTQHIASWFIDTLTGSLKAFEFFQFEYGDSSTIDDVMGDVKTQSTLMSMQMDAAFVIWENAACTFVPEQFFTDDIADTYLDIVVGDSANAKMLEEHFNDYIILSRYPSAYADAIKKHLAAGPFSHKFSFLLKKYANDISGLQTTVRGIFYPSRVLVIIFKNGVLQLVQSMTYSTAEDVLYAIMNICNNYAIALDTTKVVVTGMITAGSSLFDTLYKYIENIEIEKCPENVFAAEGFAEHPAQYFLPFIQ